MRMLSAVMPLLRSTYRRPYALALVLGTALLPSAVLLIWCSTVRFAHTAKIKASVLQFSKIKSKNCSNKAPLFCFAPRVSSVDSFGEPTARTGARNRKNQEARSKKQEADFNGLGAS